MTGFTVLHGKPWTILLIAIGGYAAIILFTYLWQEKILYFPDTYPLEMAATRARMTGFRIWPANGPGYQGFEHSGGPASPKGVVLLFHGNAGAALDRSFYATDLASLGYRLILFEYPGYGARTGGKVGEASFVSAAVVAARSAVGEFGAPLYLVGESLGCGVAAAVAGSGQVPVAGVVLITPWDTLPDMAQTVFWYLPARWLTKDRYDNIRNMNAYGGPVAVVVAEKDEVIPPRLGLRLFERISGRKKLWLLPGTGHNNWPEATDSAWWNEVMRFVSAEQVPGGRSGGRNGAIP